MNVRQLYIVFLTAFVVPVTAQVPAGLTPANLQDYQYKKEMSGGIRAQTNGVSAFLEYGWIKDIRTTRLIQLEYTYYIDYRQKKSDSQIEGGRDYFYGMQNRLNMLRFSYGGKRMIAEKADQNGVRLSLVGFGGVSLALLKPYYLDLENNVDGNQEVLPQRYSPSTAARFLSQDSIIEAAPAHYGLNEIQPVLGVHGKLGLDFDFGKKDAVVKTLEAGVMLDLYYERLQIWTANDDNRFYQAALFVSFQLGKRW